MLDQTLQDACAQEIAAADAALAASTRNPHRRVHQARKALRRVRALLALIARSDPTFATVDAKLRRATHSLSLRDAAVAVETFDRLMKRKTLHGSIKTMAPPRNDLARRRDAVLADYRQRDPGFAKLRNYLQRAGAAAKALAWSRASARAIARGLAHSRRRIAKIDERARHSNERHLRHRWRRRLRRYNEQRVLIAEILALESGNERTGTRARYAPDAPDGAQDSATRRQRTRATPLRAGPSAAQTAQTLREVNAAAESVSRSPLRRGQAIRRNALRRSTPRS